MKLYLFIFKHYLFNFFILNFTLTRNGYTCLSPIFKSNDLITKLLELYWIIRDQITINYLY